MKNRYCGLYGLFFIVVFGMASGLADTAEIPWEAQTAYAKLLARYTRVGQQHGISTVLVDYVHWGRDPLHQQALHALQRPVAGLSPQGKMAYWINAYNLLTIDLIIKTGEQRSIKNQGSVLRNVWKSHFWRIRGQRYSLDDIEHRILRPMGDPRMHMAINCASISCPDLRREPYQPDRLQAQLSEQARRFLMNAQKGLRLGSGQRVWISPIFKWFKVDFKKMGGVRAFIQAYRPTISPSWQLFGYLNYDWRLNSIKPGQAEKTDG